MMRQHSSQTLGNCSSPVQSYSWNPPLHDKWFSSLLPGCRKRWRSRVVLPSSMLSLSDYHKWLLTWFVMGWNINSKCLQAELDKQQKMLLSLRFNPQTMSPYIHKSDSLCTRTDHHMLLPIVLHMVVPLCCKQ